MKRLLHIENKRQPEILLYLLSLLLYVLLSELLFTILGYKFFWENFFINLYEAAIYLGLSFWFNHYIGISLDHYRSWQENPLRRFVLQSLIQALAVNVFLTAAYIGFRHSQFLLGNEDIFVSYKQLFFQFLIYLLLIELNVVADLGRYLLTQWHQNKLQQETFDKEKAQFNLELLRNQINPHFLFNNLNTLSALIYENQDQAADFLRMLSKVYRNILEYRNRETVSLEEEMSFFDSYTELLSIRFKDMLRVEKNVSNDLLQKTMIPLTLQMLMENAIKHNVISKNQPLVVTLENQNNYLVFSNKIQKKESLEYSSGLGLKIIESRYAFLSARKLEIENNGKTFLIKIPLL
jgi:sensor histidine kinase YesM